MLKQSVSMVSLWGGFYYTLTLACILVLKFLNFEVLATDIKWRFVEPTYLAFVYFLFSVVGFCLPCLIGRYFTQRKENGPHLNFSRPVDFTASGTVRYFFIILLLIIVVAEVFFIEGNYRSSSGVMGKLIMVPLNALLSSFVLLFVLKNKNSTNNLTLLIVLGLCVLLLSVTGAGGFFVILGVVFLSFWNGRKLSLARSLGIILLGLVSLLAMIAFLIIFKYSYQLDQVNLDLFIYLVGWIAQRVLTVTGSTVFLIENFYDMAPGFGFDGAFDVFIQNASKLLGSNSSSSAFSSLGQFNFSMFYIGDNDVGFGISPGLLGGMVFFVPWIPAAFLSGLFLFFILFFISSTWTKYLYGLDILTNLVIFLCFTRFFLLSPYDWVSIIDTGFIRLLVFVHTPLIVEFLSRIVWSNRRQKG